MTATTQDPVDAQAGWRPGWAVFVATVSLVMLALVAAALVPDLAHSFASMQRGQDLGNTLGVFVGGVWLGLVLASAVPSVRFLMVGGRAMLWSGLALALLWVGGVLALIGPDLPLLLDGLL